MYRKIFPLFVLLIALCGCSFSLPGSPQNTGYIAPYYIAQANVPFADYLHTSRWDYVEKIDEDSFGREYFLYRTYSRFLKKDIDIHIISQKSTKNGNYYYYPDQCYILIEAGETLSGTEVSEELKQQNDWELPLCEDKMALINKRSYLDRTSGQDEMADALRQHLGIGDTYAVLANPMEILEDGAQVFFAVALSRQETGSEHSHSGKFYYGIYDENAPERIVFCLEASGQLNCQEEIAAFKEEWRIGDGLREPG